jgi:hypothetical protein
MSANKFVLTHHQTEVDYTIGMTPGLPALTYKDGPKVMTFKSDEITTNETALGLLVSVRLVRTIDVGGEGFGFFLPQLDVAMGQTVEFSSSGIYEKFSGPDSVPRVAPSWRCVELKGTAQSVIVPL